MTWHNYLKLLLVSAAAACSVATAGAQTVIIEATGNVQSFQGGGWGGNSSDIGQSVTVDFAYDSSALTNSLNNGVFTESAPITSASIVNGILGSGINLEARGPGTGTFAAEANLNDNTASVRADTSVSAPSSHFTGDVFGLRFFTNGVNTTLALIENAYSNGVREGRESGTAFLSNVNVTQGTQAPEIDPTSAMSALTLLLGGLAVIRGRQLNAVKSV